MVKSKVKNQSKDAAIKAKDGRLIETQEGGPGSGCSGDNCGRKPKGSGGGKGSDQLNNQKIRDAVDSIKRDFFSSKAGLKANFGDKGSKELIDSGKKLGSLYDKIRDAHADNNVTDELKNEIKSAARDFKDKVLKNENYFKSLPKAQQERIATAVITLTRKESQEGGPGSGRYPKGSGDGEAPKSDNKSLQDEFEKKHPYVSNTKVLSDGHTKDEAIKQAKELKNKGVFASIWHQDGPKTGGKSKWFITTIADKKKESQQESGTFGPSAYLNQVFSKVKPKSFEASKPKEPAPEKSSVDVEQLVNELLNNNPTMSSSTFLNLLKSQGIKFSKEADSGSGLGALVRGKESAISFRSVKFLEKDMGPSATDVGIQKPKDKYLGFTKFRAVMLQEGLGNFGDSYFYSADALNSAAPVFEGKKIFADHPSSLDEQTRPERSVRDVLGHFENVHVEKMDDGRSQLVGDVVILPDDSFAWARSLMAHAVEFHEKFPDKDFIGLSINASGDANPTNLAEFMKNDLPESIKIKLNEAIGRGITEIKIVSKISEAVSCDLVTEAGAGGGVKNYIESRGGEMKDEQQEGGPGSGRYPKGSGGGKSDKTNSQTKSKAIVKKDKISSMHDIMKKQNLDSEYASPNTVADIAAKNGIKLTSDEVVRISDTYEHKPKKQGENMENEMQQADGIEQHPDAAQDVELIKSMLKKAFGGEEDPSQEECTIAKEAMEAFGEMGHEKDKAGELAMEFMKASKHLAQKQAQKQSEADAELKDEEQDVEESEEEIVDEEAPVKEAAKLNDEIIKLKGELARYKENDKKLSIANHIEKICKESKRSNAYTSEFKSVVKEAKSIEEVDKAWRLFEAGRKASGSSMIESAFEGIQTFATEKIVTGTDGQTTSLNFDDCKVY